MRRTERSTNNGTDSRDGDAGSSNSSRDWQSGAEIGSSEPVGNRSNRGCGGESWATGWPRGGSLEAEATQQPQPGVSHDACLPGAGLCDPIGQLLQIWSYTLETNFSRCDLSSCLPTAKMCSMVSRCDFASSSANSRVSFSMRGVTESLCLINSPSSNRFAQCCSQSLACSSRN